MKQSEWQKLKADIFSKHPKVKVEYDRRMERLRQRRGKT